MSKPRVIIGLDSGSTSVNVAVVGASNRTLVEILPYVRHHNEYEDVARGLLRDLARKYDIAGVNITGGTGEILHRTWPSSSRVAEVEAQAAGIRSLAPDVAAVIDGGGAEIKFFKIDPEGRTYDFAMNPECAAGSGSFLDVQANRLMLEIDDASNPARHFPTLGLDAIIEGKTVPISGRCSVFAKSDMIHQQQKAVPVGAIVGGLHESLVNNMKATVIQQRLRGFGGKVSFQGGLSQNASLRHCMAMQLGLGPDQLVCHPSGYATGALGAAIAGEARPFRVDDLEKRAARGEEHHVWEKLTDDFIAEKGSLGAPIMELTAEPMRAYLGIDIGSVSTKIALVDEKTEGVIYKCYGPTSGRPIEALKDRLNSMILSLAERMGLPSDISLADKADAIAGRVEIVAVCTTGSGRFMGGHFLNADCIRNEITAQAVGSVRLARMQGIRIDTIFEIGGQDSKYIKLDPDGGVRDYTMNKVCAAGCGSFLEEQADKLAISIKDEFARIALAAPRPADLGDRCTVFIESVMDNLVGFGESRDNLIAGLAYSVANNYLNRVVEGRDIEGNIFFQGGTAFNTAVTIAFQKVLKKPVWVTPHNEVTGAVGAACLAKDHVQEVLAKGETFASRASGLMEIINTPYESGERMCRQCANRCELQIVKVTDSSGRVRSIYYGDRCDEMNLNQGKGRTKKSNTYIDQRNAILFDQNLKPARPNGKRVGIPRTMSMWGEYLPLWVKLFTELGFEVVLSGETKKSTVRQGAAISLSDYCVPIRTGHGAVAELLDMDPKPDYVFIPFFVSYPARNMSTESFACLWTQCFPAQVRSAIDFDAHGVKLLSPVAEFRRGEPGKMFELVDGLSADLGMPRRAVLAALEKGFAAMDATKKRILALGREALGSFGPEKPAFLVVGRGYNAADPGLSLDIATKLERMGHPAIPMDFLPFEELPLTEAHNNMYWKNGERILQAFAYAAEREWLIPIWITNFGCGPDSFIRKQVRQVMGDRPYLELELDEHTADAGVITRIEAFYDSYRNTIAYAREREKAKPVSTHRFEATGPEARRRGRVMAFCRMDEASFALAAIFRSRGFEAVVLPRTTPESLALGKRYSSGKECVPYQTTLGDKLVFLLSEEKKYSVLPDEVLTWPRETAPAHSDIVFYDPYAQGPCRFGLYNEGYKQIYRDLGIDAHMLCTGAQNNYADVFRNKWDAFKWSLIACDGVVSTDTLQKARRVLRPVAVHPADVDRVYFDAFRKLIAILERPEDSLRATRRKMREIASLMKATAGHFAAIALDPKKVANVANVGMFGEIYVRSEPFINEFLIDKLERHGIRTFLAPVNEWIQYVNFEYLEDFKLHEKINIGRRSLWPLRETRRMLHRQKQIGAYFRRRHVPSRVRKLNAPFRALEGWIDDPKIEETIGAGEGRLPFSIRGEAILSWGLAREIQHHPDIHGIVNIGPFGCMPSKLVSSLLHDPEITKPVFDGNYDGSGANSRALKIETFASQVKAYARKSGRKKPGIVEVRGEHSRNPVG